ncbi:MAG: phosphate ABC transporter substrate-binding protein [Gammaproteobacteria bacterium]|nr:phosphate ABC transporter substrate-binding protein [Gammaproteobacteria bacterium]MDH5802887.1 phosphate ABC transporter substrate-binding protein [Gammaproteobacteria bacterium]
MLSKVFLGVAVVCLSACSDTGPSQKLVLTGSSTVAPLALEIGRRFEQQHPGVRIDVQTGGSSRGIADVRRGVSQIGMVSRALKQKEQDLSAFIIARDGVGVVVHKDNPIDNLSSSQIVDIYTGKVRNWETMSGLKAAITVVNKAEGRSTLEVFLEHFGLKNSQITADVIIGDNEQAIKTVAGNVNAIAYVSVGTAEHDIAVGVPIKLVSLDGNAAATKTIALGRYPMSRVLNLVTRHRPEGLQKQFIEFASSTQVRDLVEGQSFVAASH